MAVLILLVKYIHSKQAKKTFSAIVFHLAGICQFLNEDTVGAWYPQLGASTPAQAHHPQAPLLKAGPLSDGGSGSPGGW